MRGLLTRSRRARTAVGGLTVLAAVLGMAVLPHPGDTAYADVTPSRSSITAADGKDYWIENHLVSDAIDTQQKALAADGKRPEYLIVWTGDENAADTVVPDVRTAPGSLSDPAGTARDGAPGQDFLAVVDVTKGSPTYGKVLNTGTVGPLVENEPHHMQYVWHKGEKIYAGGLYSAATYVFDVSRLPSLSLSGVTLAAQTPCGSVPDAYWVLKDGTAYGTYMGGPVAPGPCRYTHGEVRTGNGFAGTPGEVVHLDPNGTTLSESPAAVSTPEDSKLCLNTPSLGVPSCANPHGIQVREDLDAMVTSDYAEPRNIVLDPVKAVSPYLRRPTVRTWDISDRNHPKVKSVSYLPIGPRAEPDDPLHWENRAVMETTVTNLPGHKGAFAQTMKGGAIFYTSDITSENPVWKEVFDDWAADKRFEGGGSGPGDNSGWIQTSPDDKTLYHAVIGRPKGTLGPEDPGTTGGVFSLDISKLVDAGDRYDCDITTREQAVDGGSGADCPKVRSTVTIGETQAGGPHWGALDNLLLGDDGYYHDTDQPRRLATSNYFVARTSLDGDHKVCLVDIARDGALSVDESFTDEVTGEPCVSFNRADWPHGPAGHAKPHSMLFVTGYDDIK